MNKIFSKNKKIKFLIVCFIVIAMILGISILNLKKQDTRSQSVVDPEYMTELTYEELTDEDKLVENCDYVQFSAFFTRDLDNDGYAEKLNGACNKVNKIDTLYIDLNVLSEGYLKDGKITLNADKNFIWKTSIVQDSLIKNNYIGETSEIILQDKVVCGSQKIIWGDIYSKLANNINNYSKINSVTLTGTHVIEDEDGNVVSEIEINKTVNLKVDWYGETETKISDNNSIEKRSVPGIINEDGIIVDFSFDVKEKISQLLLQKQVVEVTIPELNGYAPISVSSTNNGVRFEYDEEAKVLTIIKEAIVNENYNITSLVSNDNYYKVRVIYPIDAYNNLDEAFKSLNFKISACTYGYNNNTVINGQNVFENPHISMDSSNKTILCYRYEIPSGNILNLYTYIGEYAYNDRLKYDVREISKEIPMDIYNGNINTSKDNYIVKWDLNIGDYTSIDNIILEEPKEDDSIKSDKFDDNKSMYDYVITTGIYFKDVSNVLGNDGWIDLYDAETDEFITKFTSSNWNEYTKDLPYEVLLKSIKLKTSKPISNSYFSISQIKEINDEVLTANYTKSEFKEISRIYTYVHGTIIAPEGITYSNGSDKAEMNNLNFAYYDEVFSCAGISVVPSEISNQKTNNVDLKIKTYTNGMLTEKWRDGIFLIELPEKIIKFNVKSVTSSNPDVLISDYYTYKDNGKYYVKIFTENEEKDVYTICVNADITANPLYNTSIEIVKLYSHNSNCDNYGNWKEDLYDIDNDGYTDDAVDYSTCNLTLSNLGSSGILTTEYLTEYNDEDDEMTVAPNIADIEKSDSAKTAKVNISITNNYNGTLSEIKILGRIPFEGNKYIISDKTLNSQFTANIKERINVPENLRNHATMYYSENENTNKNLDDASNEWMLAENITDWSKIKSYLIDLGEYKLSENENDIFSYVVEVPDGLDYNTVSYSNHAVYYCLDTENGKLPISTEPNKLGMQVIGKYTLDITKCKQGVSDILIEGATYKLSTLDPEGEDVSVIGKTDENGKIVFEGIYVDKEYTLTEISAPNDYVVSSDEIKFKFTLDNEGNADVNEIEGAFKSYNITEDQSGNHVLNVILEDEPRYNLKISKTKINDNTLKVSNAVYNLEGEDNKGKKVKLTGITDGNGELILRGIYLNKEYSLKEISVGKDYLVSNDEIKFIGRLDENGKVKITINSDSTFVSEPIITTGQDGIDTVNVELEDEACFSLKINKKGENGEKLSGVKFKLIGSNILKTVESDENGEINIKDLKPNEKYTLKESKADGYYLDRDEIEFKVRRNDSNVLVVESNDIEMQNANIIEIPGVPQASINVDITNEKIPTYNLKIVKVEENFQEDNLDNLIKIENAKYEITSIDTKDVSTYTTNSDGEFVANDLYLHIQDRYITGEYLIRELDAPDGYVCNSEDIELVVTKDSSENLNAVVLNANELDTYKTVFVNDDTVILVLQNKPFFKLTKIDSETGLPLANAEFIIIEMDEFDNELDYAKDGKGNYIGTLNENGDYTVKTDENGIIVLPLTNGLYKAVEITYPEGYSEFGTEEYFKISNEPENSNGNEENNNPENSNTENNDPVNNDIDDNENNYEIYEINYIEDLVQLSESVNGGNDYNNYIIKLARDLDFESGESYRSGIVDETLIKEEDSNGFIPIGTENNSFSGIFDGQGHEIKNLYIDLENIVKYTDQSHYVGLFGYIKNAKIRNLGITGEVNYKFLNEHIAMFANSKNDYVYCGSIAGRSLNSSINNSNSKCNMNINAECLSTDISTYLVCSVGAICGYVSGGEIDNCYNTGNINIEANCYGHSSNRIMAGGISGNSLKCKIIACYNEGNISSKSCWDFAEDQVLYGENIYSKVGGIVGDISNGIIKDCYNIGSTSSECNVESNVMHEYIGGIVANASKTSIIDCYNMGIFSAKGSSSAISPYSSEVYIAGIVGYGSLECNISNVYNMADIEIDILDKGETEVYSGGIAGCIFNVTITNSSNKADINFPSAYARFQTCSGGVIGYGYNCIITNSCNIGNLNGIQLEEHDGFKMNLGGIIGKALICTIDNCYNIGNIANNNKYIGGIVGMDLNCTISNCYNSGDIDSNPKNNGGSIGGITGNTTSSEINKCYNSGDITSISNAYSYSRYYVGGIAGNTSSSTIKISYNIGNIFENNREYGSVSDVGGITGSGGTIENCYNTGSIKSIGTPDVKDYDICSCSGGITGGTATIKNSYNVGNVSSDCSMSTSDRSYAGGISGFTSSITNSYYSDLIVISGHYINQDSKENDEYMKSGEFYNVLNVDGVWKKKLGRYPVFKESESANFDYATEIVIENTIKKFKITTEVENQLGGSISGENDESYEIINYKNNNTKDIEMIPENGYEIVKITINGEKIGYTVSEDGSYLIPAGYFENVDEDKHIVVTYALKNQVLTIVKEDSADSSEKLEGVIFKIESQGEDLYYKEEITDSNGIIKVDLQPGTYKITEIKAKDGYVLDSNEHIVVMEAGVEKSITITNRKKRKLTVHHYLKGTDNKVAKDDVYDGDIGEQYETSPHIDLEGLHLEKDLNGNYVVPDNATGVYGEDNIIVKYYYELEPLTLTIHHYIYGENFVEDEQIMQNPEIIFGDDSTYTISNVYEYELNSNDKYNELLNYYSFVKVVDDKLNDLDINDKYAYNKNSEITYYYVGESKTLSIQKEWIGLSNEMASNCKSIVNIYENTETAEESNTIIEKDGKSYALVENVGDIVIIGNSGTNINLPKSSINKIREYIIEEVRAEKDGIELTENVNYIKTIDEGNIKNILTQNISGEKRWKDLTEEEANEYKSTFTLYKQTDDEENSVEINGIYYVEVDNIEVEGSGTFCFYNIPVYEDGKEIQYIIKETKVEKKVLGADENITWTECSNNDIKAIYGEGKTKLADVVKIGDYINYDASTVNIEYRPEDSETGYDEARDGRDYLQGVFSSTDTMDWIVFNVDKENGIVELIPDCPTEQKVCLYGKNAYKKGIQILDNIAKVYSHGEYAETGRSLRLEDIEKYCTFDEQYAEYNMPYDVIYYNGNFIINNEDVQATEEQPVIVTNTYSYTDYRNYINPKYLHLFEIGRYYLANQICVTERFDDYSYCNYGMLEIIWNDRNYYANVNGYDGINNYENMQAAKVMPVITLKANITTIGKNENGVWQLDEPEKNVITNVLTYPYEIHYFYDGIEDVSKVEYGADEANKVISIENKCKLGYELEEQNISSLQISTNIEENIVNVYYISTKTEYKIKKQWNDLTAEEAQNYRVTLILCKKTDDGLEEVKDLNNQNIQKTIIGNGEAVFTDIKQYENEQKVKYSVKEDLVEKTEDNGATWINIDLENIKSEVKKDNIRASLVDVVEIGDYVNYNSSPETEITYTPSFEEFGAVEYYEDENIPLEEINEIPEDTYKFSSNEEFRWRVLNVDKENGIVKIIPDIPTEKTLDLYGLNGYKNSIKLLDNISNVYAHGNYAESGRSIRIEDINEISGFDISEMNNSSEAGYKYGDLIVLMDGTVVLDDGSIVQATSENPITLNYTGYMYNPGDYIQDENVYNMLFNKNYYLANKANAEIDCGNGDEFAQCLFGVFGDGMYLWGNTLNTKAFWNTSILPVITLKEDLSTTGQDENGIWQLADPVNDIIQNTFVKSYKIQKDWDVKDVDNYRAKFELYETIDGVKTKVTDENQDIEVKIIDKNGESIKKISNSTGEGINAIICGNGTAQFMNLPIQKDGKDIIYSVDEVLVEESEDNGATWNDVTSEFRAKHRLLISDDLDEEITNSFANKFSLDIYKTEKVIVNGISQINPMENIEFNISIKNNQDEELLDINKKYITDENGNLTDAIQKISIDDINEEYTITITENTPIEYKEINPIVFTVSAKQSDDGNTFELNPEIIQLDEKNSVKVTENRILVNIENEKKSYKITAKVKDNIGGTVQNSSGEQVCENVLYGEDNKEAIIIIPEQGYNATNIIVYTDNSDGTKDEELLEIESFKNENDEIIIPAEYFRDMTANKEVVVEFKKKTNVIVKHLEKGTNNEKAPQVIIEGYVGDKYSPIPAIITGYKLAEIETNDGTKSYVTFENKDKFDLSEENEMIEDTITIVFWYEEFSEDIVLVRYIEIDENDIENGLTLESGLELDQESYTVNLGESIETTRKEFLDIETTRKYISVDGPISDNSNIIIIGKDENLYNLLYSENTGEIIEPIEIRYYYERVYNIDISIKNHVEVIDEIEKSIAGGKISNSDENPYEQIGRNGESKNAIEICPDTNYRVKYVKINEKEISLEGLEDKDKIVTIPVGYFSNIVEDKNIEIEFERIPAKVIIKYVDIETNKEIKEESIQQGNVGDLYKTEIIDILNYEIVGEQPDNSNGVMTEDDIIVVYYYKKIVIDTQKYEEKGGEIEQENLEEIELDEKNETEENEPNVSIIYEKRYKTANSDSEKINIAPKAGDDIIKYCGLLLSFVICGVIVRLISKKK